MTDIQNGATGQRDRSPAFPNITLEAALKRLGEFEAHFKRSPARPDRIGEAWGIKGRAYVDRTAAALKYFGLLEYQGSGTARQVVVSEEGRKFLRAQQEDTKREVIRSAALRPKQIAHFWERWGTDRPADAACLDELILQNGFSDSGARDFLSVYDATISFARLSESDKNEPEQSDVQRVDTHPDRSITQTHHHPVREAVSLPPDPAIATPPPQLGKPRIVMNGDRLDIHASVDLKGLRKLQTMLAKYTEILEMMGSEESEKPEGEDDESTN
ncbi:MAG TPA: hypothetical protein VIG55_02720 [Methylosinus sp.]